VDASDNPYAKIIININIKYICKGKTSFARVKQGYSKGRKSMFYWVARDTRVKSLIIYEIHYI
jgi:hypothetical protein